MHSLLYFVIAASIFTITPGVDTALVLRTSLRHGRLPGTFTAIGICLGLLLWGLAAAIGLTALLAASKAAFKIVKWSGAIYLMYLGIQMLMKPRIGDRIDSSHQRRISADRSYLWNGFFSNILNPKVGLFYTTFLPQFIPTGTSVVRFSLLLTTIDVFLALVWFTSLSAMTIRLSRFFDSPLVARNLDRISGLTFISFGVKLALTDID